MRAMKDSGVEWIGKIPQKWVLKRIKHLANNEENSFSDGDWIDSPYISDEGIRYLTTGNIGDGVYKDQGKGYITKEIFEKLKCIYAYPGDLVFSRLNTPYGRSCILPNFFPEYVIAVDNVILRTDENKRFLCYLTQCQGYQHIVEEKANGTTMKRVSRTELGNVYLPIPDRSEQERVANFLDAKCTELDALIAAKEKTNTLLKEQRQSMIYEAVTKGLDPTVPMKDSGVEWIGEIPAEWSVGKTMYALSMPITDGPHETPELLSEGIPFISAEAVSCGNGRISFDHLRGYISEDYFDECSKKYKPRMNDIYMIKSGATTGKVALVDTDKEFTIWSPLAAFRSDEAKCHYRFLFYFLQSDAYQKQVETQWTYGTQQNIGMRSLEKLLMCFPPVNKQVEIADYLDKSCKDISELIRINNFSIKKLKEYRQSLIYEAVTGKIEINQGG